VYLAHISRVAKDARFVDPYHIREFVIGRDERWLEARIELGGVMTLTPAHAKR
jgi:hypothetical protein